MRNSLETLQTQELGDTNMAMFAPVAPLDLMFDMKRRGILGGYHLLLAHDVVEHEEEYTSLFSDIEDRHIILDNSLIELGHPVDDKTMAKAASIVKPELLVLPDFLSERVKTHEASVKAAIRWTRMRLGPFMGVIQGRTKRELTFMTAQMASIPGVEALGIPRVLTDTVIPRSTFVELVAKMAPYKHLHLLGFSNNLYDDMLAAHHPNVVGIDSAVPLRMGLAGEEISLKQETHAPRGDFWETATELNDQAIRNIERVRRWIQPEIKSDSNNDEIEDTETT